MSKPSLVLVSPVKSRSGYGERGRDLVKAIFELEDLYDISIFCTSWGSCPDTGLDLSTDFGQKVKSKIRTSSLTAKPHVFIQHTVPNEFNAVGTYNIGVTAGVETNVLPAELLEGCNKMNLIIVPSKHAKDITTTTEFQMVQNNVATQKLVCKVPVEILSEGCDGKIFRTTKEDKFPDLNNVKEDFLFLVVGHWLQGDIGQDRKNIGLTIKTFFDVFKNKKNKPGLVIKTSGATFSVLDQAEIFKKVNAIKKLFPTTDDLPNVYLIHGDLTSTEMNGLYNHPKIKAMLSLTKGEGFGKPLMEFSFVGKPIICSGWSGQLDFLDSKYTHLITGTLEPVHPSAQNNFLIKDSKWFSPNISIASRILERVYTNYDNSLALAKKLQENNRSKFDLPEINKQFKDLLLKYVPKPVEKIEIKLPPFIKK